MYNRGKHTQSHLRQSTTDCQHMDIWSGHSDQTDDGLAKKTQILSAKTKTNHKKTVIISSQKGEMLQCQCSSHILNLGQRSLIKTIRKMFSASTLLCNTVCLFVNIYELSASQWQLCSTVLRFWADLLCSRHMQFSMSDCSFTQHVLNSHQSGYSLLPKTEQKHMTNVGSI